MTHIIQTVKPTNIRIITKRMKINRTTSEPAITSSITEQLTKLPSINMKMTYTKNETEIVDNSISNITPTIIPKSIPTYTTISTYFQMTVTNTTLARTYTYIVTRQHDNEFVVTSSTTVRYQTKSLTVTNTVLSTLILNIPIKIEPTNNIEQTPMTTIQTWI